MIILTSITILGIMNKLVVLLFAPEKSELTDALPYRLLPLLKREGSEWFVCM
jgi:hypothetical protein